MPAVLMTAGIAVVSLWENPQLPKEMQASDKVLHGLMYMCLAITWMIPFIHKGTARLRTYGFVLVSVTAYGALMEVLQHFCTLTRSGEMADVYADLIGALAGLILVGAVVVVLKIVNRKSPHRKSSL